MSGTLHRNIPLNQISLRDLRLFSILLLSNLAKLQQKPTLYRSVLKSFEQLREHTVNQTNFLSGRPHTQESALQELHHLFLNCYALQEDDCVVLRRVLNFAIHCFAYCGQYGELVRTDTENALYLVLQRLYEVDNTPQKITGDLEDELKRIHLSQYEFSHPYLKDKRCYSNLELSLGFVFVHSYKYAHCFDIEVLMSNHYITEAGLANKNCFIGFNELTKYPTSYLYDTIQSCNRSGFIPELHPVYNRETKQYHILPPIPLMVFSTTNPSGVGHNWVKKRFIDVAPYGHIVYRDSEVFNPATGEMIRLRKSQVAIFSSYTENPFIDPKYVATLINHPDENLRKAWAMGSWDIVSGGIFGDLWATNKHVITRFAIPETWYVDRTFDWGSSHPFSVGWWAQANGEEVDVLLDNGKWVKFAPPKGSLIQIYEYYGTEEIGTNKGLQYGAARIAKDILAIEDALYDSGWVNGHIHAGAADNQIWNKINDDNPSIAEIFESNGVTWERSNKTAGSRINGVQIMRDLLEYTANDDFESPHIYFMNNCVASISTIPILQRDDKVLDDVDTNAEDHPWDMTRYRILDGVKDGSITVKVRY